MCAHNETLVGFPKTETEADVRPTLKTGQNQTFFFFFFL